MVFALGLFEAAILAPSGARVEENGPDAGAGGVPGSERPDGPRDTSQPRPVGLIVNGWLAPDPVLIAGTPEALLVRQADMAGAGLRLPDATAGRVIAGEHYVALSSVAGVTARLEEGGAILAMTAASELFPENTFGPPVRPVTVGEIVPAGFISYDLTFTRWNGENAAFGFLDAGVSGAWGLIGSTAVAQTIGNKVVRLDSYYQRDWPDERIRLVIGDAMTRATEWNLPGAFAVRRRNHAFDHQSRLDCRQPESVGPAGCLRDRLPAGVFRGRGGDNDDHRHHRPVAAGDAELLHHPATASPRACGLFA
jgi:outer membrane usher protein